MHNYERNTAGDLRMTSLFHSMWRAALFLLAPSFLFAQDIAKTVREGQQPLVSGGYFEVGVGGGYVHNPYVNEDVYSDDYFLELDIAGEYRFRNLFFEASQGTQDGLNFGYTLWHNDDWLVDLLAASISGSLSDLDDATIHPDDNEATRNEKLEHGDTVYIGAGVRVTHYFDKYVLQYRLVSDIYDKNGLVSTLRFGRGWQVQGWHLHYILSAQYTSQETNDYWFGVTETESTTRFPTYEPSAGMSYSALFGITRPITESWVFRGYAGYLALPSTVRSSPLVYDHNWSTVIATINYVF